MSSCWASPAGSRGSRHSLLHAGAPLVRSNRRVSDGVSVQAAAATQSLSLATGACCLPHPEKVDTGGEDAFFVSASRSVVGVADGVGGWRESGVDAGDYSRTLMRIACDYFDSGSAKTGPADQKDWEETVRDGLAVAHQKTRMPGSSTACILALNSAEKYVSAVNLGDSGFIVVRNGTVVFQSPPLQHFFDCPLQLGAFPEYVEATDYPSDAQTFSLNVMAGDNIVLGTDGLWDNCPLEEVVPLLPDTDAAVAAAAEMIAAYAREHAEDEEYESPYIKSARAEGMDLPWWEKITSAKMNDGKLKLGRLTGGKLDDITVLVARVTDAAVEDSALPSEPSSSDAVSS